MHLFISAQKMTQVMKDECELYATNGKSEFHVNESVNPSDFGCAENFQSLTTFEFEL